MAQPAIPETSASGVRPPAPTATEEVIRPDPGTLARGKWEAQEWVFYVFGGVVVLLAALYAVMRMGLLKRRGGAKR